MKRIYIDGEGERHSLSIKKSDEGHVVQTPEGTQFDISGSHLNGGRCHLIVDGRPQTVFISRVGNKIFAAIGGRRFTLEKDSGSKKRRAKNEDNAGSLTSPMPGQVLKCLVQVGDTVKVGQTLIIIEAMKMEHNIKAPFDAIVTETPFGEGDIVSQGAALVVLEAKS